MTLSIEKVYFAQKDNPRYTITFEKGDILDITYFTKGIGIPSVSVLLEKLKNSKIDAEIINDVLVIETKKDAQKACEVIFSLI